MSEQTPSQAEGERPEEELGPNYARTTPSQAEGERDEEVETVQEEKAAPGRPGPNG
ncbi:hypothetical protein [Streptomyces peucetius]|uniref:Uncharacterized protein n=1 Tax=Streptomyces peucetius TaxID=1950 RepID=A0ABY6I163_STRPE|nr:hypothetical protein [Streptomyces peucetius]UYQ60504.1 hypothetical protein OGH68_02775 [Streptomyces peucetius]